MLKDTKRLIPISDRVKLTVPHKPKRWSHQDDLQEMVGKQIKINVLGASRIGILLAADAFTLKLDGGGQSAMTYFKHSLLSYNLAP